jgi:hypothetical protein
VLFMVWLLVGGDLLTSSIMTMHRPDVNTQPKNLRRTRSGRTQQIRQQCPDGLDSP